MKPEEIISQLAANRAVFKSLFEHKTEAQYKFKPDKESWSGLEILCHLYDEEREDFRFRLLNTLLTPEIQPPAIDPPGWVKQRKYSSQDYDEKLKAFLTERSTSLRRLQAVKKPQWDNVYHHPWTGPMTAYKLLTNWLAHDYHHIRQVNRRWYEYLQKNSRQDLAYAGKW